MKISCSALLKAFSEYGDIITRKQKNGDFLFVVKIDDGILASTYYKPKALRTYGENIDAKRILNFALLRAERQTKELEEKQIKEKEDMFSETAYNMEKGIVSLFERDTTCTKNLL